jgi:hypothetical protein
LELLNKLEKEYPRNTPKVEPKKPVITNPHHILSRVAYDLRTSIIVIPITSKLNIIGRRPRSMPAANNSGMFVRKFTVAV